MVADHLKEEYDSQIRKWQQYINQMVDAQNAALNTHLTVLDSARKQIEAERQAAWGMAMLALSFVSGPILSWLGSKIQYTWFPKYTERIAQRFTRVRQDFVAPWVLIQEEVLITTRCGPGYFGDSAAGCRFGHRSGPEGRQA